MFMLALIVIVAVAMFFFLRRCARCNAMPPLLRYYAASYAADDITRHYLPCALRYALAFRRDGTMSITTLLRCRYIARRHTDATLTDKAPCRYAMMSRLSATFSIPPLF